jgi:alkylated DNA repair dioxygenase AlkB
MLTQPSLFADISADATSAMPQGFRYRPELISADEEAALVAEITSLPFKPYEFRGYLANRKVAAFGFRYSYTSRKMEWAPDLPEYLRELRDKVAAFAGRRPEDFRQVLVTEYAPGVAIGWHRDRPQYGEIAGVSLLSAANFRLRRREGDRWIRASQIVEPRSAYIMAGEVRHAWEHSIPAVEALRYSLTFRTLADDFAIPNA